MNTKLVLGALAAVAVLGGAGYVMVSPNAQPVMGLSQGGLGLELAPAVGAQGDGAEVVLAQASAEANENGVYEMVLGAEDAPVTIIEYASYTCPHCATFHSSVLPQLKEAYVDTGKVRFIYREVYFDRFGLWASMVARCGGPERFFGISELIYKGQAEWTQAGDPGAIADELRKIGRLAGLDAGQLEACLTDGDKAQALVSWYEANQAEDDIRSTPSFVINGELYGNMSFSGFSEIIDAAIDG